MKNQRDERDHAFWHIFYEEFRLEAESMICLEEYKNASLAILSEEKSFTAIFSVAVAILSIATGVFSFFSKKFFTDSDVNAYTISLLIVLVSSVYTAILLCASYFASKKKSITISKRKLIILRHVLGLTYFKVNYIIPNDSEAGASNPFNIKFFESILSSSSFPIQILSVISFLTICIPLMFALEYTNTSNSLLSISISVFTAIFSSVFVFFIYRIKLFENNETIYLSMVKMLSNFLRLKLEDRFEYIIYRALLAADEIYRINIDVQSLHRILIEVEDKEFESHHGINFKRSFRALVGIVPLVNKRYSPSGGGSSITQQLARTLFIKDLHKKYRRKIIEILLALWVNKIWSKKKQLDIYLASVRFEKNVMGLDKAMIYFFDKILEKPSNAQKFFLIERVSNINSRILANKIKAQIARLLSAEMLSKDDIYELIEIYTDKSNQQKIVTNQEALNAFTLSLQRIATGQGNS